MTVWLLSVGQGVTGEHWGGRGQLPKFSAGEAEANLSAINLSLEGCGLAPQAAGQVWFRQRAGALWHLLLLAGEIKSSPSESPLMEKNSSLKEDHEEPKVPLGDGPGNAKSPIAEAVSPAPHRVAVEERTVSFNLGDLEEAPEHERLPSVDLKETNVDSGEHWRVAGGGAGVCGSLGANSPPLFPQQELCSCPTATSFSSTRP